MVTHWEFVKRALYFGHPMFVSFFVTFNVWIVAITIAMIVVFHELFVVGHWDVLGEEGSDRVDNGVFLLFLQG